MAVEAADRDTVQTQRGVFSRGRRRVVAMRLKLAALSMGLAFVAFTAPAGADGKPMKACPAGFNLGALTFAKILQLPKLQAALAAGVTTLERVQEVHAFVDKNSNGVLCVQDIAQRGKASPVSGSLYAVVLVDDNATVRD